MRALLCVMALVAASSASAAEKLAVGPPPAWVKPVAFPIDDKPDNTPVKLVLFDQQVDLQPGRTTTFGESAMRIQTPEGMTAGAVTFSWDPAIDTPTVHKLVIRRGDKVIDVLAGGQSFTVVRRERNLEYATLDGVLTATLQPEGLQVGDIVDFAVSVTSSDPALGRHVEDLAVPWNGAVIGRAHARVQWPSNLAMRLRAAGGLAEPKVMTKNGLSSIELSQDNVQPLLLPKNAPGRFQRGRFIELTDFAGWSDLATLFAPLYVKASQLKSDSPLRGEIARIAAASRDPVARAEAALALVQDRVRYVALFLNNGGLIPADADLTWSRRFGDCKGKTVLLLAILRELGIKGEPVLVGGYGDGLDKRLPTVAMFNHVMVRATVDGRVYWLDGTRQGDRRLAGIETPEFIWGLPVTPGAKLVAMVPPPRTEPDLDLTIGIDATKGINIPAAIHVERVIRGDDAIEANLAINSRTGAERDRYLRDYFKGQFDTLDAKTVSTSFDADKRVLTMLMDGTVTMDWSDGWYRVDAAAIGYKADFRRDQGPDADAPFAVNYPSYVRIRETILLPPKAGAFTLYRQSSQIDQTIAGVAYKRAMKLEGNRFTVEMSERALAPEFPFSESVAAQARLRELDNQPVALARPKLYLPTPEEIAAVRAKPPVTAEDYRRRAALFANENKYAETIADLSKALELEPDNQAALAMRALSYALTGQFAQAQRDADAALALMPDDPIALRGRAVILQGNGKFDEAIAIYDGLIKADPDDDFALAMRAEAKAAQRKDESALADVNAALKLNPRIASLYLVRANIYRRRGDHAAALREADTMISIIPDDDYVLVSAGRIYAAYQRYSQAEAAFDRALRIKPDAYVYLNRGEARDPRDYAGRQADIDAALKLRPNLIEAWYDQVALYQQQGKWPQALTAANRIFELGPATIKAYLTRARIHQRMDNNSQAVIDLGAARRQAKTASELNAVCWSKAVINIVLESALADCDAALAQTPNAPETLDSRAFVLLRMERNDEAIATYGKALALRPDHASSLYGRALAEARTGNRPAASRDLAAALAVAPRIQDQFADYGLDLTALQTAAATPRPVAASRP